MNQEQENALFKLAGAVIGRWSEAGTVERYISDDDFNQCLEVCASVNKARFEKEIAIHF